MDTKSTYLQLILIAFVCFSNCSNAENNSSIINARLDQDLFNGIELTKPTFIIDDTVLETKAINLTKKVFFNESTPEVYSQIVKEKHKAKSAQHENEYNQSFIYHKCKDLLKNYPVPANKSSYEINDNDLNESLLKGIKKEKNRLKNNNVKISFSKTMPFFAQSLLKTIEQEVNEHGLDSNDLDVSINFNLKKGTGTVSFHNNKFKFSVVKNVAKIV